MNAYIHGIGLISPQETYDPGKFLPEIREYTADFLRCIDPPYKDYINPIAARRMSRLIKMGITSALIAIRDAGMENGTPDAIITGTGLGSVEDTEKILAGMHSGETLMNPTPFIQSTYNTISSQIAITLKCHNYNSTYVHRSFSLEAALTDALLQFSENPGTTALVGGIDEMTENHLRITRRAGHWKMEPINNLRLWKYNTPGALAGEGSAYFLLSDRKSGSGYGCIRAVKTIYNPGETVNIQEALIQFLREQDIALSDIDSVILGNNGDSVHDSVYFRIASAFFENTLQLGYKHLCGEYYTSTGFAIWIAANILRHQRIPLEIILNNRNPGEFKHILIYNQYRNINHSLILVSAE